MNKFVYVGLLEILYVDLLMKVKYWGNCYDLNQNLNRGFKPKALKSAQIRSKQMCHNEESDGDAEKRSNLKTCVY